MDIPTTTRELNEKALSHWEANATFWNEYMGYEGNKYWKVLQIPCLERLLKAKLHVPALVEALELATGTGLGARWLAKQGVTSVLATDGCNKMLELCQRHIVENMLESTIQTLKVDVTSVDNLKGLTRERSSPAGRVNGFDAILMNMAIMDVPDLDPLARALPKLLTKDGVFVATLLHPVFFTAGVSKCIEERYDPLTGDLEIMRSKVIREYLNVLPSKGIAVVGQPEKQLYFHRTISELFTAFLKHGELVIDAVEEPAFTEADHDPGRVESTCNFTQVPALLTFRLRRRN